MLLQVRVLPGPPFHLILFGDKHNAPTSNDLIGALCRASELFCRRAGYPLSAGDLLFGSMFVHFACIVQRIATVAVPTLLWGASGGRLNPSFDKYIFV